jgi:hypothetical protein
MWITLTVLALALVGSPAWAGDAMVLSDDNNTSMITITAVSSVVGAQVNVIANMGSIGSASQQATLGGVADNP